MTLAVCVGNPENKPASYTRFVLPFAYRLTKAELYEGEFHYRRNDFEKDGEKERWGVKWRKQYLTGETSRALFERAGWFILEKKADSKEAGGKFRMNFASFDIEIAAPRLILFEQASAASNRNPEGEDLLQTGFLVVEIFFPEGEPTLDDLLKINERFRYKEAIYEGHKVNINEGEESKETSMWGRKLDSVFDLWEHLLSFPVVIENESEPYYLHRYFHPNTDKKDDKKGWDVYSDARAFVWTCATIPEGGRALKKEFNSCSATLKAHEFGHWIKLLNVDQPGITPRDTHSSVTEFEREWAKERTYRRWEESGTFYGFNYHSGALLGPDQPSYLSTHFGQMYFDLVMLLLYLRVTLFRFSDRLFTISADARKKPMDDDKHEAWADEFDKLRWQFTLFTNLYQFPLISNQQQAVELYSLARKYLDVDALYAEVQQEIHNSYEYLVQKREQSQTEITTLLTVVASVGAVIGLAIGAFALKPLENFASDHWALLSVIVLAISFLLFFNIMRNSDPLAKCLKRLARSGKQGKKWLPPWRD